MAKREELPTDADHNFGMVAAAGLQLPEHTGNVPVTYGVIKPTRPGAATIAVRLKAEKPTPHGR